MIKHTCQPPQVRANKIMGGLQVLDYQNNEFIRDFGLRVSLQMKEINGINHLQGREWYVLQHGEASFLTSFSMVLILSFLYSFK